MLFHSYLKIFFLSAKHDVVLETQLPVGLSGEKLKELEKGHMAEPKPEVEQPAVPPKFVTQVSLQINFS